MLNSRQRAQLRGLANHLTPVFQIGKGGVNEQLIKQTDDILEIRELIKLNEKMQNATDWEKVEIEERIGGLQFAKECLNEAWQRRKEVIQ